MYLHHFHLCVVLWEKQYSPTLVVPYTKTEGFLQV